MTAMPRWLLVTVSFLVVGLLGLAGLVLYKGASPAEGMEILFALARPDSTGPELRAQMQAAIGETPSQLDVTPLILALLGR